MFPPVTLIMYPDINFLNVDLNHVPADPIPEAIISDHSANCWLVNWKTNDAGIQEWENCSVTKDAFNAGYPRIVDTWEEKQHEEEGEARQVEGKFMIFARRFHEHTSSMLDPPAQRGVACDQALLPGMGQHWGELRSCEKHPQEHGGVSVCKGCRVGHYLLESRTFDRGLIMARGARVLACEQCAAEAMEGYDERACECDSRWTCFRCREGELVKPAKARAEKNTEGRCGRCSEEGALLEHVEFCMYRRGWRFYGAVM